MTSTVLLKRGKNDSIVVYVPKETDNQALSWLLRHAKELGRIGRWILRLAPYKYKIVHISGKSNVVADCLTHQFGDPSEQSFSGLVLQHLPSAFQSIREHQIKDAFCSEMSDKIKQQDTAVRNFKLFNDIIVYSSPRTKSRRYLVPQGLRAIVLDYFHDSKLSAHLGVAKTLHRVSKDFIDRALGPT
jgi:hypothetical protein